MKLVAVLCVVSFACDASKPTPPPAAAHPSGSAKPSYSAEAATHALGALGSCTIQFSCAAFDTLASFGGAAGAQLMAYVSDLGNTEKSRALAAVLIGMAKVPDAGPKLVEIGLSSQDATVDHAFFEAAGRCGGDATFAALAAQYDRENHGDMREHLVELRYGLKAFPKQARAWAMGALPMAKDQVKYIDVLVDIATPADRDALTAMIATTKDQMGKHRLAAEAITLGATDPALWDVFVAGLSSQVSYDRDDAGHQLQDIADKIPADRKPRFIELIKKSLAAEKDPMLQSGLAATLAKLGG